MSDDKIKFDVDGKDTHYKTEGGFTVPESGRYNINISKTFQTGETIMLHKYTHGDMLITTDRPLWWQFWKPVVITKTIYMDYRGEVVNCNDGR